MDTHERWHLGDGGIRLRRRSRPFPMLYCSDPDLSGQLDDQGSNLPLPLLPLSLSRSLSIFISISIYQLPSPPPLPSSPLSSLLSPPLLSSPLSKSRVPPRPRHHYTRLSIDSSWSLGRRRLLFSSSPHFFVRSIPSPSVGAPQTLSSSPRRETDPLLFPAYTPPPSDTRLDRDHTPDSSLSSCFSSSSTFPR